jgi:hypothetical protein
MSGARCGLPHVSSTELSLTRDVAFSGHIVRQAQGNLRNLLWYL